MKDKKTELRGVEIAFAAVVLMSLLSSSGCVEVTGQTQCWDPSGAAIAIDCVDPTGMPDPAAIGQDGAVQAGVSYNGRFGPDRFKDHGDGTVTDELTGLTWLKDANCPFFGQVLWADALKLVNSLAGGSCGLDARFSAGAFRLPNIKELQSLIDFGVARVETPTESESLALPIGHPFVNVGRRFYWSSTSRIDPQTGNASATKSFGVHLAEGRTIAHFKYHEDSNVRLTFDVWPVLAAPPRRLRLAAVEVTGQQTCWTTETPDPPVRTISPAVIEDCISAGMPHPAARRQDGAVRAGVSYSELFGRGPRFRDHGDGTVTDGLTGLRWLKNADCFGARFWPDALELANGLASDRPESCGLAAGTTFSAGAFRLPNVKELQSLVDFEGAMATGRYPALPEGHPFENVSTTYYWSSSTTRSSSVGTTTEAFGACAWAVSFNSGLTHFSPRGPGCRQTKTSVERRVWPVLDGTGLTTP